MPDAYRSAFGEPKAAEGLVAARGPSCLGQVKDYRSLVSMAAEAKKPVFLLKPGDGAIGGHQGAVRQAYTEYRALAQVILAGIEGG